MFSKGFDIARQYTGAVVVSSVNFKGDVEVSVGSFVVINKDGWVLTAAHVLEKFVNYYANKYSVDRYINEHQVIKQNEKLSLSERRTCTRKLTPNPNWLKSVAGLWSIYGEIKEFRRSDESDLAVGRIEYFNPDSVLAYPKFKNPANMKIGTSLCKLGFPYSQVNVNYDRVKNNFDFTDPFPLPLFPIEGIYARDLIACYENGVKVKFLETSSPSLPGQSGGPIFDSNGVIWAINSNTDSYPIFENQVLNVGRGVHSETIMNFLLSTGIEFEMCD